MSIFYLSALIAITGSIGYHVLQKQVPGALNPILSIMAIYVVSLIVCLLLLPFFPIEGGLMQGLRQLSWVNVALAVAVICIEIGFLLMYRNGWNLSLGNIMTNSIISIVLIAVGILAYREKLSLINVIGVLLTLVGLVLINLKSGS